MKKTMIDYIQKPKFDDIYTPAYAIKPLLKYIPKEIEKQYGYNYEYRKPIIWECTDYGSSNITKVLKENGYEVISTHKDNFNFLTDNADFNFDMIITNPPYSLKDEFLKKCYEYNKPFCLLLPITALEGKTRGELFREKDIQVIVFDGRVEYLNNKKGNWFNTSWFCWKVLPKQLIFEKLEKENEK